jgi:hypothetical protein
MNKVIEIQTRTNDECSYDYSPEEYNEATMSFLNKEAYKIIYTVQNDKEQISNITFRHHNGEIIVYGYNLQCIQDFVDFCEEVRDNEGN